MNALSGGCSQRLELSEHDGAQHLWGSPQRTDVRRRGSVSFTEGLRQVTVTRVSKTLRECRQVLLSLEDLVERARQAQALPKAVNRFDRKPMRRPTGIPCSVISIGVP